MTELLMQDCLNDWNTEYCAIKCVNLTNSSLDKFRPEQRKARLAEKVTSVQISGGYLVLGLASGAR